MAGIYRIKLLISLLKQYISLCAFLSESCPVKIVASSHRSGGRHIHLFFFGAGNFILESLTQRV